VRQLFREWGLAAAAVICLLFAMQGMAGDLAKIYDREKLLSDADLHPDVTIAVYHPTVHPDPESARVDRRITLQFQKDGSSRIELGYIEEAVPYQNGHVRIGLIIDHELRLRKAVVLAASGDLVDTFLAVTKHGLITRYTATSVRQLKYLYKVQKGRAPDVEFLAREVWILGNMLADRVSNAK